MNKSWQRLIKRKEFLAGVEGWVRTTEVTRPKDPKDKDKKYKRVCPTTGNTHAHHTFTLFWWLSRPISVKGYIKQSRWQELWADCLRVDYLPVVDVRTVKPRKKGAGDDDGMRGAIAETLKYAVKPDDIMHDAEDPKLENGSMSWPDRLINYGFVATGGLLKNALKADNELTDDDLIRTGNDDETEETDERRLNFTWYKFKGGYLYNPIHNE